MASHAAAQLLAVALGVPGEVPTGPDHTEPAPSLALSLLLEEKLGILGLAFSPTINPCSIPNPS